MCLVTNTPYKFWLSRSFVVGIRLLRSDILIERVTRWRISLRIKITSFQLEFMCFYFLTVIWVTYFGMIVWEFRYPVTF
ncbi:hypothetical protein LINPERHAP1_LOCUS6418 [Linum perenne]